MLHNIQGTSRHTCSVLVVVISNSYEKHEDEKSCYPFPEMASSGRLEIQVLANPSCQVFHETLEAFRPDLVYLSGERQSIDEEMGTMIWGGGELLDNEAISALFDAPLPTTVYLEIANGENLAELLYCKGIPFVIYWKNAFSRYAACHFRHALFSVLQSSSCHTWDCFQLAHASFRLYCLRNNRVLPDNNSNINYNYNNNNNNYYDNNNNSNINNYNDTTTVTANNNNNCHNINGDFGPHLFGDPPKIDITPTEKERDREEQYAEDEETSTCNRPAVQIYDDDVNMRFLVCGVPCELDAYLLGSLEDGLNALLNIEIRGCRLHNRVSALPPPLQASGFSRGVVTMKCDLSTCSSAYISLLVSGSAQTCFDDQILESHVKSEIIGKRQLVQGLSDCEQSKIPLSEPRRSDSIACGASVFEVCMKLPAWASQVLRQLGPDISYRSFVALGIASIQGLAVSSFEKDDADRLLFFCSKQKNDLFSPSKQPTTTSSNCIRMVPPHWLKPPVPFKNNSIRDGSPDALDIGPFRNEVKDEKKEDVGLWSEVEKKMNVAAMRPVPRTQYHRKTLPFAGMVDANGSGHGNGSNLSGVSSTKHNNSGVGPLARRKISAISNSSVLSKQIVSLNPLPLKKHGCGRNPIQHCSDEEFLRDVMQFLILRGHNRLIPQGGLAEFPDAVLNAKRLDLYNLYREVVSRGGFHVGNGINWKGQVFSKMRNYTSTNRMTGVGNTLKRHYETYLLEYELAHEDVDGECCLLCRSSAAGDWVNCGICGEWAHFGCDRRTGLGAFKDYAKTDGLEYICPHCSNTNFKKKLHKSSSGGQGLSHTARPSL